MRLMNEILRSFIGKFVVVYFDDILVYSQDEASYKEHRTQVFPVLRRQSLYAKLEKCDLFTPQSFLDMLSPVKESKLMKPRLRLLRVGPFL